MQYQIGGNINCPRDRLVTYLIDPDHIKHWQATLVSHVQMTGTPGSDGAKSRIVHAFGKRQVDMVETVETNVLPDRLAMNYEAKNAWNRVVYHFAEGSNDTTDWTMDCEFRCTGFLRLLILFAPGMFRKESQKDMANFAKYAENPQAA